jgi:hypothetical protein
MIVFARSATKFAVERVFVLSGVFFVVLDSLRERGE